MAVDCLCRSNANEQPSLSPSSFSYSPDAPPRLPQHSHRPPPLHHHRVFLMFRIQPPICSTSPYLIVQNDTLTFYGEPIILSYTVHWLCEPTCPDQLGSERVGSGGGSGGGAGGGGGGCGGGGGLVAGRLIVLSMTPPLGRSDQLETEMWLLWRRGGVSRGEDVGEVRVRGWFGVEK